LVHYQTPGNLLPSLPSLASLSILSPPIAEFLAHQVAISTAAKETDTLTLSTHVPSSLIFEGPREALPSEVCRIILGSGSDHHAGSGQDRQCLRSSVIWSQSDTQVPFALFRPVACKRASRVVERSSRRRRMPYASDYSVRLDDRLSEYRCLSPILHLTNRFSCRDLSLTILRFGILLSWLLWPSGQKPSPKYRQNAGWSSVGERARVLYLHLKYRTVL
jgi:hypothetical protein